ncbi:MAG: SMC-Scp complex subunit ScpB [Thermoplasmata archaeon]|nr:SMC-Scp complex subunit ScpB [Thermoplasmata archaeon]
MEEGRKRKGTEGDAVEKGVFEVEAVLFSAGRPMRAGEIAEVLGMEAGEVRKHLKKLVRLYSSRETAIEIVKVDTGYTFQVKREYAEEAKEVAPTDIPPEVMKTLALIGYYQPLAQSRLVEMVGSKTRAYRHIQTLVEMGLVSSRPKGRTRVLTTTKRFLERFNIPGCSREDIRKALTGQLTEGEKDGKGG